MFTVANVKELREATGAGLHECSRAMELTHGNREMSIRYLREKGQAVVRRYKCPVCDLVYRYHTFLD